MIAGFRVSKDLTLPPEAATWTFAVLAIKGAGKTYVSADLAEEFVKAEIPIVVIDGLGIWWGLTVGVNGHKGLPVVVVGGKHKDLDLPLKQIDRIRQNVDEDKLRLMVKAVLESRVSVVLDTSGLSKGIQRRIVATFVSELTRLNADYGTRHVFIEEADLWCPQRGLMGGGDLAISAGAIDDLVRRGGNFNLGCTLITQRSAVLNKDVLTQASCLFVLRILHKIDKDAVKTWVESMADPKDPKIIKWYDALRDLRNGETFVWHPENPVIFRKVQFRERETLHATREYFQQVKTTEVKALDRSEFIEKFRNVFEPKPKPILETKPKPTFPSQAAVSTDLPTFIPTVLRTELERSCGPGLVSTYPLSRLRRIRDTEPSVTLEVRKPTANVETRKPGLPASDRDVLGRILYAINQGCFDERQTLPKTVEILTQFGWTHDRREVEQALVQLCDLKFFTRKISSGNMYWYTTTQDAKQRIVLLEVNAV